MSKFSEPATGKCQNCGDQLLSIPGRDYEGQRRIICPVCSVNNLEDALEKLRWRPTDEEAVRMAE